MRIAACLLVTLCAPAQSVVRKGKPYSIHVHFEDEACAYHAEMLATATWQLALAFLKPDAKAKANADFEVHLYQDAAKYHAAGERLKSAYHKDAPGFADSRTRSCHVLVDKRDELPGLPVGAQSLVVHECMHLAIYVANPGSTFLPEWFAEGIPLWAEHEVITPLVADSIDEGRAEAGSAWIAKELVAADQWPGVRSVLDGEPGALDRMHRYVVFAHVARFFAGQQELWNRLWAVSREPVGPSMAARLRDEVANGAADGLDAMDKELRAFVAASVAATPAKAAEPAAAVGGPGKADFVPAAPRVRWLGARTQRSLEMQASVLLQGSGSPQADAVFEGGGARWLRVTVYGGDGIHVSQRNDDGSWRAIGAHRVAADVPVGAPVAIRIAVNGERLDLDLAGKRVLSVGVPGFEPRGRWGLGLAAGASAQWSGLRVR